MLGESFEYTSIGFWALIIGGLGLFLFGITFLSSNLKTVADGDRFRRVMSKATSNYFKSCAIGTGFTAVIQSSGGASALSIGLVKAGALSERSAVAIIIGANIGTCITAFLIAIPGISQFMPFIGFAAALVMMIVHNRKAQLWSKMVFAFSLIFFGIWLMESNLKELSNYDWFKDLMTFLNAHPWLGLLFGTIVTLVFQSSGAVVGVLQGIYAAAIVGSGISMFGMFPIVLGANIGAVIPSILTAFGGSATAKRVALSNLIMKVAGALLFMGITYALSDFLLNSMNWALNDAKLQIALSHLIFNIACAIIFLPLIGPLCNLTKLIIKDKNSYGAAPTFKELDPKVMKAFPSTGISLANDLSLKMFDYALVMFEKLKIYASSFEPDLKDYILEHERAIDNIDRHLADFFLHTETGALSYIDQVKYGRMMRAIKDIERIGDYGENLLNFYSNMDEKKEEFDDAQKSELVRAHDAAMDLIKKTIETYKNADVNLALVVIKQRRAINKELEAFQEAYFKREMEKKGIEKNSYISLVYVDILNSYERVYAHCSNIAKLFNSDRDINRYSKTDEHQFAKMSSRY